VIRYQRTWAVETDETNHSNLNVLYDQSGAVRTFGFYSRWTGQRGKTKYLKKVQLSQAKKAVHPQNSKKFMTAIDKDAPVDTRKHIPLAHE